MPNIPSEGNKALLINLSLQTDNLTPEQAATLQQYLGTSEGIIGRQLLVPEMMRLHSLHYAIQAAFGWLNAAGHRFILPDAELQDMTNGTFRDWRDLVGVYFRVPGVPQESYYPSETPTQNQTYKAWLKNRYNGPYSWDIGTYFEHLVTARLFLKTVLEPEVEEEEETADEQSIEETEAVSDETEAGSETPGEGEREEESAPQPVDWDAITIGEAAELLHGPLGELIERDKIGQILCPPEAKRVTRRQLDRIAGKAEIAAAVGEHMTYPITVEISDHVLDYEQGNMPLDVLELQDTYERVLSETDLSTIPAASTLDYYYDAGQGWHVRVDCIETYELVGYEPGRLPTQLYTVVDHTGAEVMEEAQDVVADVILENRPLCTGVLGPNPLPGADSMAEFADFIASYRGRNREERENAERRARREGWQIEPPEPAEVL